MELQTHPYAAGSQVAAHTLRSQWACIRRANCCIWHRNWI